MEGNVFAKYCKRINQEMRALFFKIYDTNFEILQNIRKSHLKAKALATL